MVEKHLVSDSIEYMRHVAQVGDGEHGVQQLPLAPVLSRPRRQHSGTQEKDQTTAWCLMSVSRHAEMSCELLRGSKSLLKELLFFHEETV